MDIKKAMPIVVVALIAGWAGFGGGVAYQKSKSPSGMFAMRAGEGMPGGMNGGDAAGGFRERMGGAGADGQARRGGMGAGGFGGTMLGMTMGEVLKKDEQSITVKLPDGGSRIVFVTEKTTVATSEAGSMEDVIVGANVRVTGPAGEDGSVTGQSIQVVPAPMAPPAI